MNEDYKNKVKNLLFPDSNAEVDNFSNNELKRIFEYAEDYNAIGITKLYRSDIALNKQGISLEILKDDGNTSGIVLTD